MSLRRRLLLAVLALVGVGLTVLGDIALKDLRRRYLESTEEIMVDAANLFAALAAADAAEGRPRLAGWREALKEAGERRLTARIYDLVKTQVDMRVYVTDQRGVVILDSRDGQDEGKDYSRWRDVLITLMGGYGARSTRRDPDDPASAMLHVAAPVVVDGRIAGVLVVVKPVDSMSLFLDLARRRTVIAVAALAAVMAALGVAVTLWITRPIARLQAYAEGLRGGRAAAPPTDGPREIRMLGETLAGLVEALDARRYAERYVQALVHEMKSPLSAVRAAAELLGEDMQGDQRARFLANIRRESARLQDLVDMQLRLAAVESRKAPMDPERLALAALVDDAAAALEPALRRKRLALECAIEARTEVVGERFLLRQALVNLLQNAIDFSPEGGRIALAARRVGGRVELVVDDAGPGLPDYALGRVFERFYSLPRPDGSDKGTGLGLTFVREVATLHGGAARLENRPGGGARATLELPAAPAVADSVGG